MLMFVARWCQARNIKILSWAPKEKYTIFSQLLFTSVLVCGYTFLGNLLFLLNQRQKYTDHDKIQKCKCLLPESVRWEI
jgi:hypothetical protein